jgi:cyclopropane fatty-acyl-phospholipid synthase-like methyltransferase
MSNKPVNPACLRNQQPIADILQHYLTEQTYLLEIGSGTGQHAVYCAKRLPLLHWQPTELAANIANIELWRQDAALANILAPLVLDIERAWPVTQADNIFTANTVHFISQQAVMALFAGAARLLPSQGLLMIYGPFNKGHQYTSEGNRSLDEWLKTVVNPEAGIKDIDDITRLAADYGLTPVANHTMPANNLMLVFSR